MAPKVLSALDSAKTQYYHFKAIVVAGMGLFTDAYDLFCIPPIMKLLGRIYYNHRPRYEVPAAVTSAMLAPPSSAPSSASSCSATSVTALAAAASTDLRPAFPGVLQVYAWGSAATTRSPPPSCRSSPTDEARSVYSGGVLDAGVRDSCELHRDDGGVHRV
ncbi:UNVERIFIED_CONTAM: putative inorganic phosphate transporter 1-10 [Sesamum calycinum]|uniref:Inorganic phosphate transporter 1-10 n=1 Tax=Sesamum calycinum TaxID=2727403 RepID=A0AAW2L9R3_9LAMI